MYVENNQPKKQKKNRNERAKVKDSFETENKNYCKNKKNPFKCNK